MTVSFTVPGQVRGKGRPRIGRAGPHARLIAEPKTVAYENQVAHCASLAMRGRLPFDVALVVTIRARMAPPGSASRRQRAAMLDGSAPPARKPDLDNIVKVLDALNGIVFRDDALIVKIVAEKVYAETPGLDVTVAPYTALM